MHLFVFFPSTKLSIVMLEVVGHCQISSPPQDCVDHYMMIK